MTRCSHPDCDREAVGSEQRQTATMPAPGFYPYCADHVSIPCHDPRADPQDAADYPDEPRQCVCGWLISTHEVTR